MVEMDFRNPAREADWHTWYLQHIDSSARCRFPRQPALSRHHADAVTLAMHDGVSGEVFQSAVRANGGPAATGEWQTERTDWYCNLFDGIDSTPLRARPPTDLLSCARSLRPGSRSTPAAASWVRHPGGGPST